MDLSVWLTFAAASLAMARIPGPGVASIIGFAMRSGRSTALASVGGKAIGNLLAMALSLGGVGAVLAASALAFAMLKWAGALYLIGLGLLAIAPSSRPVSPAAPRVPIAESRFLQQSRRRHSSSKDDHLFRRLCTTIHRSGQQQHASGGDFSNNIRIHRRYYRHRIRAGRIARVSHDQGADGAKIVRADWRGLHAERRRCDGVGATIVRSGGVAQSCVPIPTDARPHPRRPFPPALTPASPRFRRSAPAMPGRPSTSAAGTRGASGGR